jgi:thioesterase domain-containing protein
MITVPPDARLVRLQKGSKRPTFFMVDSYPYFLDVVKLLGTHQPIVSLIGYEEILRTGHYTIEHEAAQHVDTIVRQQLREPYVIGGCSASALVAYETAQQLIARGLEVQLLVLFDMPNPYFMREYSRLRMTLHFYHEQLHRLRLSEFPGWVVETCKDVAIKHSRRLLRILDNKTSADAFDPSEARIAVAGRYRPAPYPGDVLLVKRCREVLVGRYRDPQYGWGDTIKGKLEICEVNSVEHLDLFKSASDRELVVKSLRTHLSDTVDPYILEPLPSAGLVHKSHVGHLQ